MARQRGFTLIEMLLTSVLMAGISLSVFLCVANGLQLWDRTRGLMVEEDIAVFFNRFGGDVRQAFPFSTLSFTGEEFSVEIPTVVLTAADRAGTRAAEGYIDQLGRVKYEFDPSTRMLLRRQANYGQAVHQTWGEPRPLVKGITGVKFAYYFPNIKDYHLTVAKNDPLPSGIEITIVVGEGEAERRFVRYFPLPLGAG